MTKLDWNRKNWSSSLNSDYWTDPRTGFDQEWHKQQKHKQAQLEKEKQFLGTHSSHQLDRIQTQSGPHAGKLICITCNNKFLKWLPREAF